MGRGWGRGEGFGGGLNTLLSKQIHLSYLLCIMYLGLPLSVSCPVERNVDEESLCLVSVSKGFAYLL